VNEQQKKPQTQTKQSERVKKWVNIKSGAGQEDTSPKYLQRAKLFLMPLIFLAFSLG